MLGASWLCSGDKNLHGVVDMMVRLWNSISMALIMLCMFVACVLSVSVGMSMHLSVLRLILLFKLNLH